jgi:hypothetical protein
MKRYAMCFLLLFCVSYVFSQETITDEDRYYEMKQAALEKILGKMYDKVGHAIIPFDVGGSVDMYYFPQENGTAMLTMELLRLEGDLPKETRMGTYELLAFTKNQIDSESFSKIERRMCGIFTVLGNYGQEEILNPNDTCEIPDDNGNMCLVLVEYPTSGKFNFDKKRHGLLLVIEVFESEMNYAMKYGTKKLIDKLKAEKFYPYSDLDRKNVVR